MNAAVEADDELQEIARRLQAGPEEVLSLKVLSPAEERDLRQQREARESEGAPPRTHWSGVERLVEAVFGKGPQPTGVDEDLKVLLVQEFLTQRKAPGRATPP